MLQWWLGKLVYSVFHPIRVKAIGAFRAPKPRGQAGEGSLKSQQASRQQWPEWRWTLESLLWSQITCFGVFTSGLRLCVRDKPGTRVCKHSPSISSTFYWVTEWQKVFHCPSLSIFGVALSSYCSASSQSEERDLNSPVHSEMPQIEVKYCRSDIRLRLGW